jgi:hypothetical protein
MSHLKITSDHLNSGFLHPYWEERVKQDRAWSETWGIKQIFIAENQWLQKKIKSFS